MDASLNRIILSYLRAVKYIEEQELQEKIRFVQTKLQQQDDLEAHEEKKTLPNSEDLNSNHTDSNSPDTDNNTDPNTNTTTTPQEPINVSTVVQTINESIQDQGFKITKSINEINNSMNYVFVNLSSDQEVDKQLSIFKDSEIYMIKLIIHQLFNNNYHMPPSILTNQLLAITNDETNAYTTTKSSKEVGRLIDRLISLGYLQLVNNAYLIMTIRLLSELKFYLTSNFDVIYCTTCNEIVTIGIRNGDRAFHYKCYEIYARNHSIEGDEGTSKIGIEL